MIPKFYIQKTDKSGAAQGSVKDLEVDYSGLNYKECKGLSSVGKPKNIYTENYAEADGLRVYHPADSSGGEIAREVTAIELTLVFIGDSRRSSYDSFNEFVSSGRIFYWDTARFRKVWLVLDEAVEPSEDVIKGTQYIMATFKFKNLWGEGRPCTSSGNIVLSN